MHDVIVTAPGSLGDVNPLLAIARLMQAAGRDVLFLAAERYLHLARRAGIQSQALVTEEQFGRLVADPRLWHPRHGAQLIFGETIGDFLHSHYRWLEQNCEPGKTLLISHVLDLAGRIYRDRYPATRLVNVLPAPALLRSKQSPPRLSGFSWERWIPSSLMPLVYRAADFWVDGIAARQINAMRNELGLSPVRRLLHRWWYSPDLVLCLFPEWFSVAQGDLLPQMRLTGFPLADSGDLVGDQVAGELEEVLQRLEGKSPIVFAPGTAHHHAGPFLHSASEACRRLNAAGVLLSPEASQFPADLPPHVVVANYLPFKQLLKHAAAIVHHGGIGTTSQSLAAGIPQLVLPMAFDQFDNAERVAKLGCGCWLPMSKLSTDRLASLLRQLPLRAGKTQNVVERIRNENSFGETVLRYLE